MGILNRVRTQEVREAFVRYKRKREKYDKKEVEDMAAYILSDECVRDIDRMIRGDYRLSPPYHYRVPKDLSGRKRHVYSYKGPEKYLLKLIAYGLHDHDGMFSQGLYSFRTSRTAQDFLLALRDNKETPRYYIIKADVSNYVGSIVPEKIIPRLEQLFSGDPSFMELLKAVLLRRECIERDGSVVSCEPGGLGGVPLANLFMNVYLMEMDEYFYPRAPLYCRYSDDIIIFARSRQEAEDYLQVFHRILEEKELKTNPKKTYLIEPGEEVEILGCKLKEGRLDISDHAMRKLKRKIRMRARFLVRNKWQQGLSDEECGLRMVQYCNKLFFGGGIAHQHTWARWLFPVITDTAGLEELDHYVQNTIRFSITGTMGDRRYRIRYQELKKLGYRSLVHAYYHFERE